MPESRIVSSRIGLAALALGPIALVIPTHLIAVRLGLIGSKYLELFLFTIPYLISSLALFWYPSKSPLQPLRWLIYLPICAAILILFYLVLGRVAGGFAWI